MRSNTAFAIVLVAFCACMAIIVAAGTAADAYVAAAKASAPVCRFPEPHP